MSHFCHAEPVEACRDIKHLHSPFPSARSGWQWWLFMSS